MTVAAPAAPEQLLTPKEVAKLLKVSEQTLAHWRVSKRVALPYLPISNRCVRYRASDVQRFIAGYLPVPSEE